MAPQTLSNRPIALPDDSVVLGPDGVSITLSVTTTRLKPVAPRAYFLTPLAGQPTQTPSAAPSWK